MLELRTYQREAIDALYAYWDKGGGSPLLVCPTGGGKSLILATVMQELLRDYPDMRVLCVTHVKELLVQNMQELLGVWPLAPAGLYSAGLGRRDAHARIIFGGVQTIANKTQQIGHIDLVLIDEAHLVPRKSETQYGKLFAGLRAINPDLRIAGLTATPFRLGEGLLTDGDGAMFDDIAFEIKVGELIDAGHLCRPVSKGMATGYDLEGVGRVGGDYNQGKLQAAVDKEAVTRAAVDEVVRYGDNRKSWLFFCAGVEHAYHMRDEVRSRGISCETVAGETPAADRDRILADFKAGRVRAVTNNSVLTTGFNHPGVDLLALCRPTLSTSLYIQMVGRGLRNAPGKQNCLILDFAGCVRRHGPIDAVRVKEPGKGEGEAPVKECPPDDGGCGSLVHASVRVCPDCGHEFPPNEEPKHAAQADITPVLSTAPPVWHAVTGRTFREHPARPGKPPSVKVTYMMGLHAQNEWVCPQHDGYAGAKAQRYWMAHGGTRPFPKSVVEFLDRAGELRATAEIQLKPNGRYQDVIGWRARAAGDVQVAA